MIPQSTGFFFLKSDQHFMSNIISVNDVAVTKEFKDKIRIKLIASP